MSDDAARALISFLATVLMFAVAFLVMLLMASAPELLAWAVLFGVTWVALFSVIHVRRSA